MVKYTSFSQGVIIKRSDPYSLQIIFAYASTGPADDESVEQLYENIMRPKQPQKTLYVIITSDFNAKIGRNQSDDGDHNMA